METVDKLQEMTTYDVRLNKDLWVYEVGCGDRWLCIGDEDADMGELESSLAMCVNTLDSGNWAE